MDEMDDMDRTNSMGLWRYSKEFYAAADIIIKSEPNSGISTVAYYLICHSLELSMKSFLRGKGASLDLLRCKLGHDLAKLLKKVEKSNIGKFVEITDVDRQAIKVINPYYKNKEFEYITTGCKTFPEIDLLVAFADKLICKTEGFCFDSMNIHDSK
ncbi:MAG: hypothetical protein AAB210_03935 [Deltaproteobacteria bacterium]